MRHAILSGLACCLAAPLWAGTISLETQITTSVSKETADIAVNMVNRGTESAYNVQVSVEAPGEPVQSPVVPLLPVGEKYAYTFHRSLKGLSPGRYVCLIKTVYADANLYPYSALSISSFIHQKDSNMPVLGLMERVNLQKTAKMKLRLKNFSPESQSATLRLLLPQELSANEPIRQITLPANQETSLTLVLRNFSALPGSTYPIYAILERDTGGLHAAAVFAGMVSIRPPNLLALMLSYLPVILLGVLGFAGLIGGRVYWERKKKARLTSRVTSSKQ